MSDFIRFKIQSPIAMWFVLPADDISGVAYNDSGPTRDITIYQGYGENGDTWRVHPDCVKQVKAKLSSLGWPVGDSQEIE